MSLSPLTRKGALAAALPLMAANVSSPLVGLVDTAVIGRGGSAADLAAVALGTLVFNSLYWTLGFLRMGTTGLTAQASSGGQPSEVAAHLLRAVVVGLGLGGRAARRAGAPPRDGLRAPVRLRRGGGRRPELRRRAHLGAPRRRSPASRSTAG